jgi:4-amino-4-deoxy-L-arabinose transferase-like glycosyltransferase
VRERLSVRHIAIVASIALGVRVAYPLAFMRHYVPDSDADSYFSIGRAVSRGEGYAFSLPFEFVHATAIRPPLYPTVLAGPFRVFGAHVGVAQGVNIVAGSIVVVLGALIAARISAPRAGLCAGIVLALYPPLIANDVVVLVESLAVLLVFATVLLLIDGRTVLAGVALGLLMLDRASAQWFVVVVAGWVVWRFGWQHAARLVVVALLVASPWIVRNAVQVGGPVLVATNGFNLNAIYSDEAHQSSGGFVDAYYDPRFANLRTESVDEVDLDARLRQHAWHDLSAHPARILHVARVNVEHWLELRPGLNRDAERHDGRNLSVRAWTLPLFYLVTGAGLFALVRARRSAADQLLALAAGYFTVVCLFSISVPRLRSVFDGCVALGAGLTLAWAIDRNMKVCDRPPTVRPLRAVPSAIILALIAVVVVTTAFAWRSGTHRQARRAVEIAVARDESAIDALIEQYRARVPAKEPPRLVQRDLDRIQDLTAVLGNRAPQVAGGLRPGVTDALRAVRVASHEANVISLLSAAEFLHATTEHRSPSRDAVRTRYEREIRPDDPTLESWNEVLSGRPLQRARLAVGELRRIAGA